LVGQYPNSYAISAGYSEYEVWIDDVELKYEDESILPEFKTNGIFGCGLVLDPENTLAIFFTVNGRLMGELTLEILRINKKKWMLMYSSISN
jgi:hypothetical protein